MPCSRGSNLKDNFGSERRARLDLVGAGSLYLAAARFSLHFRSDAPTFHFASRVTNKELVCSPGAAVKNEINDG